MLPMIRDNICKVKERLFSACSRTGRDCRAITIVAVAKGRSAGQIKEVLDAGIADIGENRVQEAVVKYRQFSAVKDRAPDIKWHMVGHLQTNKVRDAVRIFNLIHSVDSLHLARKIDREACRINKVQDILIEIKTSPEETKSGLEPQEAIGVMKTLAEFKNINILGLMTIAPFGANPEEARPYFRTLRELRDKINKLQVAGKDLEVLSMGMTDDFEAAIEEGANMVRIGRAIFEV